MECANRAHITEANPGTSRGAILPRSCPGGGDRGLSRSPPEASYGAHPLFLFPSLAMGLCHREFNPRQPHFSPRWLGNLTRCHPPGNKNRGLWGAHNKPAYYLSREGGQVQGWLNPKRNKPTILFPSVPSDGGKPDPLTEATGPSPGGLPVQHAKPFQYAKPFQHAKPFQCEAISICGAISIY